MHQLPTLYCCRDIARTRFHRSRSLQQGQSSNQGHDVAHLQPLTSVPTKYQLPTPYGFRDIAWTSFYRSRSLRQGQIKDRPRRSTPTPPNQCPYRVSTSYTLRFPRYRPDKHPPVAHPTHPDTMGDNNTLTALKGCEVKRPSVSLFICSMGFQI